MSFPPRPTCECGHGYGWHSNFFRGCARDFCPCRRYWPWDLTRPEPDAMMAAQCIDQNGSSPLVHHVIVRADIPVGVMAANLVHAAGESSDRVPSKTIAVALHARDEIHLRTLQSRLFEADIPHTSIVEEDGEYAGQLMAVGVEPTTDREKVRKVLSSLPLVK